MGGKRIAEQVRRALIMAAKTGTVVVAMDAAGCGDDSLCAAEVPPCKKVPATGTYGFEATAFVYPFDAGSDASMAFRPNQLCEEFSPGTSAELPLELCAKFCADPRYEFPDKYSDADKIVSCSTPDATIVQASSGCFPIHLACAAEYPPGATKCAPEPPYDAGPVTGYDASP